MAFKMKTKIASIGKIARNWVRVYFAWYFIDWLLPTLRSFTIINKWMQEDLFIVAHYVYAAYDGEQKAKASQNAK